VSLDVLVIGGGPAGLATAIAGRLAGLDVTVVERSEPPIDKACGEGLMPDGLARLRDLGVRLDPYRLRAFHGIRYVDGATVAEGRFPGVHGAGVRRLDLHLALAERAAELGVRLLWKTRVLGLSANGAGVETTSGALDGRWIVGADGLRSRVRRWIGLEGRPCRRPRFGVRRHFAVAPWTDLVEVYWADRCEAYVTPVGEREVGVAILWSGEKADFDRQMALFPALRERLGEARSTSRDRGAGPLRQRVRGVARGRVALVGDASGYVDAITGEGLSLAFHQAGVLIEAIRRGDLARYARHHRRLGRWPNGLTRVLLSVEARPGLRRRVIRALADDPSLFGRILAVHSGASPVRGLGLTTAPRLLWRLVRS
jgi:flavin-dependent dehydrogenase